MKLSLFLVVFCTVSTFAQRLNNTIILVHSLRNELDTGQSKLAFIVNNGKDTIQLEQLISHDVRCFENEIRIVDSIDLNEDGVKEIFLYREWSCFDSPPDFHPYGVGDQRQSYSKYEVWDVKAKKQLFEIKNKTEVMIVVSTNVVINHGYHFDVKIDKKGTLTSLNYRGDTTGFEIGSYQYSKETETYIKE
jgi:hypothetical protein